jgi:hypothetical protein
MRYAIWIKLMCGMAIKGYDCGRQRVIFRRLYKFIKKFLMAQVKRVKLAYTYRGFRPIARKLAH